MPEKPYEPHPNPAVEGVKIAVCAVILILVIAYFLGLLSAVSPNHAVTEEDLIAPLPTEIHRVR